MKKPVIGITGNEKTHPDDDIMMSYAAKGFVEGVKDAGGIPIILPIGNQEMACHYISMIDKLILTGGQNVDPKFYGEPKTIDSDDYHLQRDIFETGPHQGSDLNRKSQFFLSVVELNSLTLPWVELCTKISKTIGRIVPPSYTTQRLSDRTKYRSPRNLWRNLPYQLLHHQSIKDLAPNLKIAAHDPKDGIIEAVMSTDDVAFLGVQWHPEFLFENRPKDKKLFDYVG